MKYRINSSGQLVIEAREEAKCVKRHTFDSGAEVVIFHAKHQRKNHFLVSYRYADKSAQNWNHFGSRAEADSSFRTLVEIHKKALE